MDEAYANYLSDDGLISRKIFFDSDIYHKELERVFARAWLFLGHENQVPDAGDYFTNYMGEDPVIIWRDRRGMEHTCFVKPAWEGGVEV